MDKPDTFSDDEMVRLVYGLAVGMGDGGFTHADGLAFVQDCVEAVTGAELVRLVIAGKLAVRWDREAKEPTFLRMPDDARPLPSGPLL